MRVTYTPECAGTNDPQDYTNKLEHAADYYPYGSILRQFVNTSGPEKYLTTHHERDQETELDYRGARYYDSDVARFLSLDPLAAQRVSLSPYNYVSANPISRTDPDGKLDDWVGKRSSSGDVTWTWEESITSEHQAKDAGYDEYRTPGSIEVVNGKEVMLGDAGAMYAGILGIHSNVGPHGGFTDGHAWLSTSNVRGTLEATYGLWPDTHPILANPTSPLYAPDPAGSISDVRTNIEKGAGYAGSGSNFSHYQYATEDQLSQLTNTGYSEWG